MGTSIEVRKAEMEFAGLQSMSWRCLEMAGELGKAATVSATITELTDKMFVELDELSGELIEEKDRRQR